MLDGGSEEAGFLAKLSAFYGDVATGVPKLNFVVGDRRMYSKAELAQRHTLPAVLVADLEPETSTALVARLRNDGFKVSTTTPRPLARKRRNARWRAAGWMAGVLAALGVLSAQGNIVGFVIVLTISLIAAVIAGFGTRQRRLTREAQNRPLGELRTTPAMLPASDAQVAAIAAALTAARSPDVRASEMRATLHVECRRVRCGICGFHRAQDFAHLCDAVLAGRVRHRFVMSVAHSDGLHHFGGGRADASHLHRHIIAVIQEEPELVKIRVRHRAWRTEHDLYRLRRSAAPATWAREPRVADGGCSWVAGLCRGRAVVR